MSERRQQLLTASAYSALLVVAGLAACTRTDLAPASRDTVPSNAALGADSAFGVQLADTIVHGYHGADTVRLDSLRARMTLLEDSLARAHERDEPRLLLDVGRTKRLYVAPYDGPHADYARSTTDDFIHDEVGGRYVYRGRHLRELAARFPAHPLADDAGWQFTLLTPAGECEGSVICHVEYRWRMVRDFLRTYPESPLRSACARPRDRRVRRPPARDRGHHAAERVLRRRRPSAAPRRLRFGDGRTSHAAARARGAVQRADSEQDGTPVARVSGRPHTAVA